MTVTESPGDQAPWDAVAEQHIEQTSPYDIDPKEVAQTVIETVTEHPSRGYVEAYVRDRMWYRRGV